MPDKIFYVIGVDMGWCGLFAIVSHQLAHIAYAVERGYTPIVDLQNFNSQYRQSKNANAWEYFFEQPMSLQLDKIKRSKHVIHSVCYEDPPDKKYRFSYDTTIYDEKKIKYWRNMYRKYIRINEVKRDSFFKTKTELFSNKGRILGVHLRGTDFIKLEPKNHPIQPVPSEVLERVKIALLEWNCDHVYLATEDADIYDFFQSDLGEKLIRHNVIRWRKEDLGLTKSNANVFSDVHKRINSGSEYLCNMYLLSQCSCFISGNTRGALGVMLMTEGFDEYYTYNLGLYK